MSLVKPVCSRPNSRRWAAANCTLTVTTFWACLTYIHRRIRLLSVFLVQPVHVLESSLARIRSRLCVCAAYICVCVCVCVCGDDDVAYIHTYILRAIRVHHTIFNNLNVGRTVHCYPARLRLQMSASGTGSALERMFSVPKPTVLAYAGSPCEIQVPSRPRDWYGNKTAVDDSLGRPFTPASKQTFSRTHGARLTVASTFIQSYVIR